jgi:hypothetical protein
MHRTAPTSIRVIIARICMLYILNTRRSLRLNEISNVLSGKNHTSLPSSRPIWRQDAQVELSTLSGVHVHTQIETSNSCDVSRIE